jgi:hypothetical protein
MPVDLSTDLAGIRLPNPVMTASGCAAAGRELDTFFDVAQLGAVVTKSIMRDPRSGRPTPRMAETPSGMLNSIGLQGPGIDSFLAKDLPWLVARGARPIVSIAGGTTEEFVELARRVAASPGVAAVEVNISCPNVENRGLVFACDPGSASDVVAAVRAAVPRGLPLLAKLTPDVTDIVSVARSVVEAGADQHTAGPAHRPSDAAPRARRRHRWPVGSRGAPGRSALRVAGAPGDAAGAAGGGGRRPYGGGRVGVPGRRCHRGPGGDSDVQRPVGPHAGRP